MKKQPVPETIKTVSNEKKFSSFGYYMAWLLFLSTIGGAIYSAIKDKQPPKKDDYYK